ncbi:MAG TPA: SEC59/DGK1/VTE5 family protein [Bacteroidota bacterium]|nr:SEC59/DGK1/VTE5 family protein [Bacteroidota bacterium]
MINAETNIDQTYEVELVRKAIHLCSLAIPVYYFFHQRDAALRLFIPVTLFVIVVDLGRYYIPPLGQLFGSIFGWLLRAHETDKKTKRLNGASYVLLSATLCVLIFPKVIAISSFSILIIGDLFAALIGRRFGKHKIFGKSVEGTLAFFATGLLVMCLTPKVEYRAVEYLIGTIGVAVAALIEVLPLPFDDNLSVPLAAGFVMWAGYWMVGM